jgi:hypothetical protein
METPARERGISRRSWLLAGLTIPLFNARGADSLNVRYDGDTIRVTAPSLHFLSGKPLERLRDGAAIAYVAQLELLNEAHEPFRTQKARFVVSFALWEEKFSVTQLGKTPRSVDGLSASATEAWCFEGLALSTLGVAPDRYFWLRFAMRTGGPRDLDGETAGGISIKDLIDRLGQKKQTDTNYWGPLEVRMRLSDLPRIQGRGSRG